MFWMMTRSYIKHKGYLFLLCTSQIEASTSPSGHTPGVWCFFLPGREGIWSPLIGGGEFERYPWFHVTTHADSTWVYKSWRRQTLMYSRENIADSWKPKAYTSFVLYINILNCTWLDVFIWNIPRISSFNDIRCEAFAILCYISADGMTLIWRRKAKFRSVRWLLYFYFWFASFASSDWSTHIFVIRVYYGGPAEGWHRS